MKKESNDILLGGGDTLVYLARPMNKKYSITFVWSIHLVRTYVRTYVHLVRSRLYAYVLI